MKTLTIIFLMVFLAGSSLSIATEKPSKIKFNEQSHDFGKVEAGEELTYTFKFKNTGSGKLIIQSVNASCGCTGVNADKKTEYKKNESGEIKVSFNTRGREGVQTKTVTVQTNDPENPQIVLSFTCEILKTN